MEEFTITGEHIRLLKRMYIGWQDCEYGAPEIDPKRPYGNSSVAHDIAEILDWKLDEDGPSEEQEDRAWEVHRQTETALQIMLCTDKLQDGTYVKQEKYDSRSWKKKE